MLGFKDVFDIICQDINEIIGVDLLKIKGFVTLLNFF